MAKIDNAIKQARLNNNFIRPQTVANLFLNIDDISKGHNILNEQDKANIEVKLTLLKSYIAETTQAVTAAHENMVARKNQSKYYKMSKKKQPEKKKRSKRPTSAETYQN